MPVKLKSSQVQQNFGQAVDRALLEDDVIVERYGIPRVAIIEYNRYRRLVEAEQELLRSRLQQASAAASARAAHLTEDEVEDLIERARTASTAAMKELLVARWLRAPVSAEGEKDQRSQAIENQAVM